MDTRTMGFCFNGVPVVEVCRSWWSDDYKEDMSDIFLVTVDGNAVPESDERDYKWLRQR